MSRHGTKLRQRFKKQGTFSLFCPTLSNDAGKTFYYAAALNLSAGAFSFKAGKTFRSAGAEEKDAGKTFYNAAALKQSAGAFHFKAGKTFGSAGAEEKYAGKTFGPGALIVEVTPQANCRIGTVSNDLCYRLYKVSYLRHYISALDFLILSGQKVKLHIY